MSDDIVTRLRVPLPYNLLGLTTKDLGNERREAADEIERLREWASYEHAGYCACAGGDNDCVNKAYETFRKVFDV